MTTHQQHIPRLIAHRGWASHYPENTLPAIMAALSAGACFIEIDIQMTREGIPVLLHDVNTQRTTNHAANITELSWQECSSLDAGYPEKFGNRFKSTRIATLFEFVELISQWPQATAFVEIKDESLQRFGIESVMDTILNLLRPLQQRAIPISYNDQTLTYARQQGCAKIGWIVKHYDNEAQRTANELQPDFLFCNHNKLSGPPYWAGPWQWACYEITAPDQAIALAQSGIDLIETMAIGDMLEHPLLSTKSCINNESI